MGVARRLMTGLLLAGVYVAAGIFGTALITLPPGNLTMIWLASGVGLIAYQVLGRAAFPWVLAASLVVNAPAIIRSSAHLPLPVVLLVSLLAAGGDAVQSLLAWRLALRLERRADQPLFTRSAHLVPFFLTVCLLPPLLTVWAMVGLSALVAPGPQQVAVLALRTFYVIVADTLGLLLVGPLLWGWRLRATQSPSSIRQHLLFGLALAAALALSFARLPIVAVVTFPLILVASRKRRLWDTAIDMVAVACLMSVAVARGWNPLVGPPGPAAFLTLSVFLLSLAFVAYTATLTNGELAEAESDLQRRIEARTADLTRATQRLEQEVAERQTVEQDLRTSEARYRLLAETTRDIIVVHNGDGTVAYVNPAGLSVSGYGLDEVLGRPITTFVPPESIPGVGVRRARRLAGDESTLRFETEVVTRSGQRIPVEVDSTPLHRSAQDDQFLIVIRDLADRRLAEAAVRESEARYRQVIEVAGGVAYEVDRITDRFAFIETGIEGLLGYRPDEISPTLYRDAILEVGADTEVPEDDTGGRAAFRVADRRLRRRDGSSVWVMDCSVRVRNSQGEIVRTVGMLQDITVRKEQEARLLAVQTELRDALRQAHASQQALHSVLDDQKAVEAALRESQTRFQVLFESNPLSIGLYAADGGLLQCNPAMVGLLGYTAEELSAIDPTHPDDRDDGLDRYHRLASGEIDRYEREKRYVCRDGRIIWVQITATRVADEGGALRYVMLVNRDITDRREAEQRLLESETMLRLIFENASDGINVYEELPGFRRRLVDCNERYAEMAGRSKAELLEAGTTRGMQRNLGAQRSTEEARRLREERTPYRGTISWIRPDGKDNVIEYTAVPVELRGRWMTIGIDRDITDRIRAEEALREYADRLEELVTERTRALEAAQERLLRQTRLATLGQLAGSIAHELRTPLGAMKNAAYLLGMLLEPTDGTVREALGILDQEVSRSDRIITTLLNFARPHAPRRQVVEVGDAVARALERLETSPAIRVDVDAAADLPPVVVDATHLDQVLNNLLANAVQAMPDGGSLTVQVERREALPEIETPGFGPEDPGTALGGWVSIRVSDTGTGIAPENTESLFEPLFTTKARGFGLGLALVKLLVQANGGAIGVTSAPAEGAAFDVYLPAAPLSALEETTG